jgi:hypothetical protein
MRLLLGAILMTPIMAHAQTSQIQIPQAKPLPTSVPNFANGIWGPILPLEKAGFQNARHVDIDRDGRHEIIVVRGNSYPPNPPQRELPQILSPRADGTYVDATRRFFRRPSRDLGPGDVVITDLNGDNFPDVFLPLSGYEYPNRAPGYPNALWLSNGKGKLRNLSGKLPSFSDFAHGAAAGDVNRDGYIDIFVATICCAKRPDGDPYFLMGTKSGIPKADHDRFPIYEKHTDYTIWPNPRYTGAAIADVNGDKWPDLILGSDGDSRNVVHFNRKGKFKSVPDVTLPAGLFGGIGTVTIGVEASDINTDGWPDLLLTQTRSDYNGKGIQILINKGNGRFRDETNKRMLKGSGFSRKLSWVQRLFITDFFGDGLIDFVGFNMANGEPANAPLLWINTGDGRFQPYNRKLWEPNTCCFQNAVVFPVDANGDGRIDLARRRTHAEDTSGTLFGVQTFLNQGPRITGNAVAPAIIRQPTLQNVKAGNRAVLSVAVTGDRPLQFRWYKGAKRVKGGKGPILSFERARKAHTGRYRVEITNAAGKTRSEWALLRIR